MDLCLHNSGYLSSANSEDIIYSDPYGDTPAADPLKPPALPIADPLLAMPTDPYYDMLNKNTPRASSLRQPMPPPIGCRKRMPSCSEPHTIALCGDKPPVCLDSEEKRLEVTSKCPPGDMALCMHRGAYLPSNSYEELYYGDAVVDSNMKPQEYPYNYPDCRNIMPSCPKSDTIYVCGDRPPICGDVDFQEFVNDCPYQAVHLCPENSHYFRSIPTGKGFNSGGSSHRSLVWSSFFGLVVAAMAWM